jgi:hypothetical protein
VPDELDVPVAVVELPGLVELATCESVLEVGDGVELVGSSSRLVLDGVVVLPGVELLVLVEAIPVLLLPVSRVALLELSGLVRGSSGVVDVEVVPVLATSLLSVLRLRPEVELANSDELVELLEGVLLVATSAD